jgi:hypothetical protein
MAKKKPNGKTVEVITHDADKGKNIPTAEFQSVVKQEQQHPLRVAYERRNRDLDPQLVWRGKDEQDWSDLVVHAPPYIQEKVHPKVLIDDLCRLGFQPDPERRPVQLDLYADFNGIPEGVDRTDFYQHDQNWSNRMILGDSLQVMASLAEREGLRGKVQCIYIDPPYGRWPPTPATSSSTPRAVPAPPPTSPSNGAAAGSRSTRRAWPWRWPVPASWAPAIRTTCSPIRAKASSRKPSWSVG